MENRGSQGDRVRGGRLVRAGSADIQEGNRGMGQFKRVKGKNGKTVYMNSSGGGFAPTRQYTDRIAQGKQSKGRGAGMIQESKAKRSRSLQGVSAMKRGRLVARGGAATAALGALGAVGSVKAGERYRADRVRQMDQALNPLPDNARPTPAVLSDRSRQEALRRARLNGR
jgi:hypothetical protein